MIPTPPERNLEKRMEQVAATCDERIKQASATDLNSDEEVGWRLAWSGAAHMIRQALKSAE